MNFNIYNFVLWIVILVLVKKWVEKVKDCNLDEVHGRVIAASVIEVAGVKMGWCLRKIWQRRELVGEEEGPFGKEP